MGRTKRSIATLGLALACATPSRAAREWRGGGKLLLTDGISGVEGAAGGGLAPWALIAGNETDAGIGATAHITQVRLRDYRLTSAGAAVGLLDRLELSYAHQTFDTRATGALLGLGRGYAFHQDVIGAKLRLVGEGVYGQDSLLPQIAIGAQFKRADRAAVIGAIGGRGHKGVDLYASATKLILSRSLLLDATVRLTKANQFGLLGFGGDRKSGFSAEFEGSAAWLVSRRLALGAEFRAKPDNLGFAREQDAWDLFAAWALARNLTFAAAFVDLGAIATRPRQRGAFLSLKAGF